MGIPQFQRSARTPNFFAPHAAQVSATSTLGPHRDWSIALGTGRLQPGAFPAKWQADPTAAPSCTTDFVIYGLNSVGATGGQPGIVGLKNLYSDGANPLCGGAQPSFLFSYNSTADTSPQRYLLGFDGSGVLQTGSSVSLTTDTAARCGPVTEFRNSNIAGGTDFFFWGVTRSCPGFGITGCVMALANETTLSTAKVNGGTSGIIIDNNYVTLTGGSSVHFSSGAVPNNAIKLTQQGLQYGIPISKTQLPRSLVVSPSECGRSDFDSF